MAQLKPRHVKYYSNNMKTSSPSFISAAMREIRPWSCSSCTHTTRISDLEEIQPIGRQPGRGSYRQLIRHRDHPRTARLAEIKILLNPCSVCPGWGPLCQFYTSHCGDLLSNSIFLGFLCPWKKLIVNSHCCPGEGVNTLKAMQPVWQSKTLQEIFECAHFWFCFQRSGSDRSFKLGLCFSVIS